MKQNNKWLIMCISLLVFILILTLITNGFNFLERIDLTANQLMPGIQNSMITAIAKAIDFLFDITTMIIISIILALILWIKKYKKEAIFFAIIMLINSGFIYLFKEVIQRARPLNAIVAEAGFAFPSGHATTAVVFFGLLVHLVLKSNFSRSFKISSLISVFLILLIGFSRIYLNVHWFSDVLGGFALGLFIITGSILAKEYFEG